MPDTLTPREIADLRQRLADSNGPNDDVGNAVFGGPEEAEEMATRLLAHIDALTAEHDACVETVGHSLACPRNVREEPHDA